MGGRKKSRNLIYALKNCVTSAPITIKRQVLETFRTEFQANQTRNVENMCRTSRTPLGMSLGRFSRNLHSIKQFCVPTYTKFHGNPTNGLAADTTSLTDRADVHKRHFCTFCKNTFLQKTGHIYCMSLGNSTGETGENHGAAREDGRYLSRNCSSAAPYTRQKRHCLANFRWDSCILQSVLRQGHRLFQRQFCTERQPVLPLSISSISV